MKSFAALMMLASALAAPGLAPTLAQAKTVKITAQLASYRGPAAYVAIYLTKPNGRYHSTLYVAGRKAKYRKHLRGWQRGVSRAGGKIDGVTGASVGSRKSLTVNVRIADALIDAGYQVRVDSAVEDVGEHRSEIVMPLNRSRSGVPVAGMGFVSSLTVKI